MDNFGQGLEKEVGQVEILNKYLKYGVDVALFLGTTDQACRFPKEGI